MHLPDPVARRPPATGGTGPAGSGGAGASPSREVPDVTDDGPTWFDDELDDARRPRRRVWLVLAAATLPWLVVATLVVRGGPTASAADAPAAPAPAGTVDDTAAAPRDRTAPVDGPDDTAPTAGSADLAAIAGVGGPSSGDVTAVATAVARAWLSDAGPDLTVDGVDPDRRAYLEHVTTRRVALPSETTAVVTLSVVLLVRDDDRYVETVVRHVAVPLTVTDEGVRPAGAPWWLPDETVLTPAPPRSTTVDDAEHHVAATRALEGAGYEDVELHELAHGDDELAIATVSARTASGEVVAGEVWLARLDETYLALGVDPLGAADDPATDRTGTDPSATDPTDTDTDEPEVAP